MPNVSVVIPALNEEEVIGRAVAAVPVGIAAEIIVVDNGSIDRTPEEACKAGASVVSEPARGNGPARRAGRGGGCTAYFRGLRDNRAHGCRSLGRSIGNAYVDSAHCRRGLRPGPWVENVGTSRRQIDVRRSNLRIAPRVVADPMVLWCSL